MSGSLWRRGLGFFVDTKLVVFGLLGLLVGWGLRVAPMELDALELPRDPVPVDAIPDVGENQQIVFTEWPGRSPRDVDDQITYPLTSALLGIPGVRTVRSSSAFGFSTIYVIFEDDVELYWSRARVLEKLASLPAGTLPNGLSPTLGPDATALGQVFWYTLEGQSPSGDTVGGWDLHELRTLQDWTVRFALASVPGVSEVSSVGGHVQEYQVDVDPDALRVHGVSLAQVSDAVRSSNLDVGARTIEVNRVEYVVRGVGLLDEMADLEQAVVDVREGTPIRVADVARVQLGPALRRGGLDDAGAEAVGGVVVARYGENPRAVIEGVRARIEEISPGLPSRTLEDGTVSQVTIVPFYDRAELIDETVETLSSALWQEILITLIVVMVMLRRLRSAVVVSAILPLGVLTALVIMRVVGVDANIMALGGIAIAIGSMVDMGIVFTENIAQHLDALGPDEPRADAVKTAAAEVAPAIVTSVLTTVVSFLPVFALTSAEARLFTPLAYTKTFAMLGALVLTLVVIPSLAHLLMRPRPAALEGGQWWRRALGSALRREHVLDWLLVAAGVALARWQLAPGLVVVGLGAMRLAAPSMPERARRWVDRAEIALAAGAVAVALAFDWAPLGVGRGALLNLVFVASVVLTLLGAFRLFERIYPAALELFLEHKAAFVALPAMIVVGGLCAWLGFGRLFGWLPRVVLESAPAEKLAEQLPGLGREYMPPFDEGAYLYMPTTMPHASVGEVRAMVSDIDAAIATLPEVDRVVGKWGRVDSALDPAPVSMIETLVTYVPEYRTEPDGTRVRQWRDHVREPRDIWDEIARVARRPGLTGAPVLMPISTRIVMLQSGMRAPMGLKVRGPDLETIERFARQVEARLREVPEVREETVFAERVVGKPYLEIVIDRPAIAQHGLSVASVQRTIAAALGGETLTRTVEGRERFAVRVRYMREERDGVEALGGVMIDAPGGPVPLSQLSRIEYTRGPQMIRSEDTFLTTYVLFDRAPGVAEVDAVEAAEAHLAAAIEAGEVRVPAGVSYRFAGTYEAQQRSEERLAYLVPVALTLVMMILYLVFRRASTTAFIYSGVAVAVGGAFLLLWLYGQPWFLDVSVLGVDLRELLGVRETHLSTAVWIGVIALVGIATDDGVVMATYLDQRLKGRAHVDAAAIRRDVVLAASRRVRPCLMTTATTVLALLPILTSRGRGADVMAPMAIPMVGGMGVALITLFLLPVLYAWAEEARARRRAGPSEGLWPRLVAAVHGAPAPAMVQDKENQE